MDHPFEVGKAYHNRNGRYEVLAIEEPEMRVRFEDGSETSLNIATQALLWKMWQNAPAPEPAHEPPAVTKKPKPKSKKAGKPKAPVANKQEKLIDELLQDDTAIVEILRRLVIPPGQLDLYRLFIKNPDEWFSMQQIADAVRGGNIASEQGVFMAFGRRIGESPDERVRSLKPYNRLFFERKKEGGETFLRIRPRVLEIFQSYKGFYDYLISYPDSWLAEEWGSQHWENSPDVYRRQMVYFGLLDLD